jgi:hypothetical protein
MSDLIRFTWAMVTATVTIGWFFRIAWPVLAIPLSIPFALARVYSPVPIMTGIANVAHYFILAGSFVLMRKEWLVSYPDQVPYMNALTVLIPVIFMAGTLIEKMQDRDNLYFAYKEAEQSGTRKEYDDLGDAWLLHVQGVPWLGWTSLACLSWFAVVIYFPKFYSNFFFDWIDTAFDWFLKIPILPLLLMITSILVFILMIIKILAFSVSKVTQRFAY